MTVEDPGSLAAERRAALIEGLVRASALAFGSETAPIWHERLAHGWFEGLSRLYLILGPDDRLIGWTAYRAALLRRRRCLYMDSTGVVPEFQRHGLIPAVQMGAARRELIRSPLRPLFLFYRTRNPVVYRGLTRTLGSGNVSPPLEGLPQVDMQRLGEAAHTWIDDQFDFDPEQLVVRGVYARGAPLYGEDQEPRSGDAAVDRLFERSLGEEDAFLIIARVSMPRLALDPLARMARRLVSGDRRGLERGAG